MGFGGLGAGVRSWGLGFAFFGVGWAGGSLVFCYKGKGEWDATFWFSVPFVRRGRMGMGTFG